MIGEEIMTDAVAPGPPEQLVAVETEKIAGGLQVGPIAQLECGVKMPVGVDLHQVDRMVVAAAAQEREEIPHPIGLAKAEHVAIELGHPLDVGNEERDVTQLVRDDALGREPLAGERVPLEHLHHRPLRILEGDHVRNRGFGVLAPLGFDAMALNLFLERAEVFLGPDLEAEAHASRLRSLVQHHRMMVDGRRKIDGVFAFVGERETDHLGVILGLLVDVGHFVDRVGDLLDADHADLRKCLLSIHRAGFERGSAAMTSTIAATSFSPKPMSMNLS